MTGFLAVLASEGAAAPTANLNVGSNAGGAASASCTINATGTITFTGNTSSSANNWWNLFGGISGNTYWVKFHVTSGTAWTSGGLVDGTIYPTTSARVVGWATASSITATVVVTFYSDAGATIPIGVLTLSVSLN